MRRSHEGLNPSYIRKDNYKGLPVELDEFNYHYADCGHVIMSVPECLLGEAEKNGDLDMFEVPVPCKYVLQNGYRIYKKHVIVNIPYGEFGVDYDDEYIEL